MKTEKILKPGQPGTKKWTEKFGKDLICIRYRIDRTANRRLKTAEIIIDEKPAVKIRSRIPSNKLMELRINYNDTYLRRIVKSAGGRWEPIKKVWLLPYGNIINLGLEKKMLQKE